MIEIKYEYTKTPLDYQITEYDCGTTTLLNALRYLFKRSEISPEVYKYIMQYTLDQTNSFGEFGKGGTSVNAMESLCEWLNINANSKGMNIRCTSIQKNDISIYNLELQKKINEGAVAIVRLFQDGEHYCLLTKIDENYAYLFDPYYLNINYYDSDNDVEIIKDRPFEFNRKIRKERMEENTTRDFALVKNEHREIIVIERI
jgi:predicted double-glycine peptidase